MNNNVAEGLVQRLVRSMRPRSTTSFFINGLPGSGKSYLLNEIADQVTNTLPRIIPLGTYSAATPEEISPLILKACYDAGLSKIPPPDDLTDFALVWDWLGENINATENQSLMVLIEILEPIQANAAAIRLFSAIRALETTKERRRFGLHFVVAGYWSHSALEIYFNRTNISFPYTIDSNYYVWNGISESVMKELIPSDYDHRDLWGRLLYELTGGYPAAAKDILSATRYERLTLERLINATYEAARDKPIAIKLCAIWQKLPAETLCLIVPMLLQRHVKVSPAMRYVDDLLTSGIAQRKALGTDTYLEFRSSYIELVVRFHLKELGLYEQTQAPILPEDLIITVMTFNEEAFQLIHDIESCARHLVSIHLSMKVQDNKDILKGRSKVKNRDTNTLEDLYDRTTAWRKRSSSKGLMVKHNPLITYCTTRELADLISEIGQELKKDEWKGIANSIRELADVRDAVMHNQLIEFDTLEKLYRLQAKIYHLLNSENT